MNQALLTRLFKSLEGDADSAMIKVAYSIIDEERRKGHTVLAEKLRGILQKNIGRNSEGKPVLKLTKDGSFKIPVDRRYRLELATHVEHESLRHYMVLAKSVEEKILRVEKEYSGRERLAHHGLKPRKKILLFGASGCGKSMAAERIAWDLGLPFYRVRFDTIISSYLGESASNLQTLFESVSEFPCVLLLDEFDIISKQRGVSTNDVGEIHRIVNILLGLLEEYDGEGILIATTNLQDVIDRALYRRFDEFIEFPKPSEAEIFGVLSMSFSALTLNSRISLSKYAKLMVGLSYAVVVKIANDAAKKAVLVGRQEVSISDLDQSLEENQLLNG